MTDNTSVQAPSEGGDIPSISPAVQINAPESSGPSVGSQSQQFSENPPPINPVTVGKTSDGREKK